ncbi:hypothetical protein FOZ62_015944 [Perkinsus olseni]|uniref:Uncharacterized protein n=1 Tax=Perkinsus olseni TaxID=32597 RepID=A0A7J6PJY7_PEROL|nr:hypothetical protein FOZ62_015944 [Perkinsus olseni]
MVEASEQSASDELLEEAIELSGIIEMSRVFPSSCSKDLLLQVFDDVCASLGYTVYEKASTSTTALKDLSLSSPALLKCVTPVWNRSQNMVKNLAVCRCTVKSSSGSADEKSSLEGSGEFKMLVFTASDSPSNRGVENQLEEKLGDLSHYWMSVMHGAIEENGTGRGADDAYEFFRGILENMNYSVGLEAASFCEEFRRKYLPREEPSWTLPHLPEPTTEVEEAAERITASIRKNILAQGLSVAQDVMYREYLPSAACCVRRYLYGRVGGILWDVYCRYYSRDDKEFVNRCDRLRERYTVESLPVLCGVREDFIGQAGESSDLQQFYVAGSNRLREVEDAMTAGGGFYPTAMEQLLSVAPLLREEAAKASEGRKELIDMDDLMPVYIFALLMSGMTKPFAVWHLLLDTLSEEQRLQGEGKAVALLEGSSTAISFGKWGEVQDG